MKDIILDKFGEINPIVHCLDHGFVILKDCSPRLIEDKEESIDYAIAEAARCSYQRGTKTIRDDKTLIRYLMRHNHTSPFEMIEFKFDVKLPIFISRQWVRHRTASISELSGRYSEMPEEYYIPEIDNFRKQNIINKQGSEENIFPAQSEQIKKHIKYCSEENFNFYHYFLQEGLCREQSRMILCLNTYTQWYWKIDLKNLLHFLDLRCDDHAQWEIRRYADAILDLIRPIVPWTIAAWEDYSPYREGIILTKYEVNKIKEIIEGTKQTHKLVSKRIEEIGELENLEWDKKAKRLGIE